MNRAFGLLALAACACVPDTPLPGDEAMGTYAFAAEPLQILCEIPDVPAGGFQFQGSFSRDSATGAAWFRLNNFIRDATFDGQLLSSTYSAARVFGDTCAGCSTVLEEHFDLALLSKSQNDALGDGCPANPLDGGLPSGPGVTPPGALPTGYDAVRTCGELTDVVLATALDGQVCDDRCGRCTMRYTLIGARR